MADEIPPVAVGDDPALPGVVNMMDQALIWIGFDNEATRNRIQVEGFESFDDLKSMKERTSGTLRSSMGAVLLLMDDSFLVSDASGTSLTLSIGSKTLSGLAERLI